MSGSFIFSFIRALLLKLKLAREGYLSGRALSPSQMAEKKTRTCLRLDSDAPSMFVTTAYVSVVILPALAGELATARPRI